VIAADAERHALGSAPDEFRMQQRVELLAVAGGERGIEGSGEIGGGAAFHPKNPPFKPLLSTKFSQGLIPTGKTPLKLENAGAIIRTVSRIILAQTAGLRKRAGPAMGDAAMNVVPRASQWGELIRPDRVHGSLYSDPAIFEAELQNIWYRTWVFVGHESEVPKANDYVVKSIGPQSVIMTRDEQGKVNLLLNRCSHRGNQLCSYDKGRML
jgi:hypothetical protein